MAGRIWSSKPGTVDSEATTDRVRAIATEICTIAAGPSKRSDWQPVTESLSAIVPCYNAHSTVTATMESLAGSDVSPAEVVCVDDGSNDDTATVIQRFAREAQICVRVESLPMNSGAATARNRGAHAAKGDLLLFVDADVVIRPQTIGAMLAKLRETGAFAVVAHYEPSSATGGLLAGFQSLLASGTFRGLDHDDLPYLGTQCVLVRRRAFIRSGGFRERYLGATVEDLEFGFRLRSCGHRITLAQSAPIVHNRTYTFRSFTMNYVDKARGLGLLVREFGSRDSALGKGYSSWQHVVSLGLVIVGLGAGALAAIPSLRPIALPALAVTTAFLLYVWREFARDAIRVQGPWRMTLYLVLRVYVTIVSGLGALSGLCMARRVTWRPMSDM